jgi:hypothetical protein
MYMLLYINSSGLSSATVQMPNPSFHRTAFGSR